MRPQGRMETLAQIIVELMCARTVSQAELAKRLEVSSRSIRQSVLDLVSAGMPIERSEDHPHVFYSVPRDWVPHGLSLTASEARELMQLLARVPSAGARRAALIARLGIHEPGLALNLTLADALEPGELAFLEELEEAALERRALQVRY
ncbi:MAG TPA: HTH domain-containing protein, partial [Polyangiales bacterium]|nr:HTH domain-containing protein [Polyangiales bacterium]